MLLILQFIPICNVISGEWLSCYPERTLTSNGILETELPDFSDWAVLQNFLGFTEGAEGPKL